MVPAKDISKWQGTYSETGEPIVFCKISGGDDGLYFDSSAGSNYDAIIANGHAFGGYHFAGGTDPVAEAHKFVQGMKPLVNGEVPALDWEVANFSGDAPAWCDQFIEAVRAECGNPEQGGLIYMNLATLLAHDWSVPLSKWGLWLADWNNNPNIDVNTDGTPYVMQQYNDGPSYDHDEWFGTVEEFKQYGWHDSTVTTTTTVPVPIETTTTTTTQSPSPEQTTTTTVAPAPPAPDPTTTTSTTVTPVPEVSPTTTTTTTVSPQTTQTSSKGQQTTWLAVIVFILVSIINRLQGKKK